MDFLERVDRARETAREVFFERVFFGSMAIIVISFLIALFGL